MKKAEYVTSFYVIPENRVVSVSFVLSESCLTLVACSDLAYAALTRGAEQAEEELPLRMRRSVW